MVILTKENILNSLNFLPVELKTICLNHFISQPEDIKLLSKVSLVSHEWNNLVRRVIIKNMNLNKWSFESIGLKNTKNALKFVKVFGGALDYLDLGNLENSAYVCSYILQTYCPKVWEVTKKLKELETKTDYLQIHKKQQITQIFKDLSKSIFDISIEVSSNFEHLDLPNEIIQSLQELDKHIANSKWLYIRTIINLKNYFFQFGLNEKTPLGRSLVWKLAVERLIEHLRKSKLTHACQIAERCDQQIIDCSESIMSWFDGIELSEEDIFHLCNLDRSIRHESRRVIKTSNNLSAFVDELKQKLSKIRTQLN